MLLKSLLFLILLGISLQGAARYLSPIPAPEQELINLETVPCDATCLKGHLEHGEPFSFLARYQKGMGESLRYQANRYKELIGVRILVEEATYGKFAVALLLPQKVIGRYTVSTSKAMLAYLLTRGGSFEYALFDSGDEQPASLHKALEAIKKQGFEQVVAVLTQEGVRALAQSKTSLKIFIPTVHRSELEGVALPEGFSFGGIDYEAQIRALLGHAPSEVAVFHDESPLGRRLGVQIAKEGVRVVINDSIEDAQKAGLKRAIKDRSGILQRSGVFLNTPIVQSSLLLSQMSYFEVEPSALLSTQINYKPAIFTLTQERDRKRFLIANSIGRVDGLLQ